MPLEQPLGAPRIEPQNPRSDAERLLGKGVKLAPAIITPQLILQQLANDTQRPGALIALSRRHGLSTYEERRFRLPLRHKGQQIALLAPIAAVNLPKQCDVVSVETVATSGNGGTDLETVFHGSSLLKRGDCRSARRRKTR